MKKYIFFLIAAFLLFSCETSTETSASKEKGDAASKKAALEAAQVAEYSLTVGFTDKYDGKTTTDKITQGDSTEALTTIRNIYLNDTFKFELAAPAVKNDATVLEGSTITSYEITATIDTKDKLTSDGKTALKLVDESKDTYVIEGASLNFSLVMGETAKGERKITKVVANGTTSDGKAFKATTATDYSVNLYTAMKFTDADGTAVEAIHGLFTGARKDIEAPLGDNTFDTSYETAGTGKDVTILAAAWAAAIPHAVLTKNKVVGITVSGAKLTGNYPQGLKLFVTKDATDADATAYVAKGEHKVANLNPVPASQGYEIIVGDENIVADFTIFVFNKYAGNKCYFDIQFSSDENTNVFTDGDVPAAFQLMLGS